MSSKKAFLTGVVIGGFLVLLACLVHQSARIAVIRAHFHSDVTHPVGAMLADINENVDEGETDLALKKLQLLEQLWRKYEQGGDSPELFIKTVTGLRREQAAIPQ